MNNNPAVSIITATYNSAKEIRDTYLSIEKQTFTDWEWLVTDDNSTDSTLSILKDIALADFRVKVFSNSENSGAAVSRNKSISQARGRYLAFIDSDDLWAPSKLQKQVEFMSSNKAFSFTAYELIDEQGEPLNTIVDYNNCSSVTYKDMLRKKATMGCSTVMVRRGAFEDLSMPLLRTGQDYATWLKLLKVCDKAYLLNEVLTSYRIMPNSISRNKLKKAIRQWQIYRDLENLDIYNAALCFFCYAWRAIFRR